MKTFRAIAAVAFFAVISAGSAFAQGAAQPRPGTAQPPRTGAQTPSTTPATSANIPDSKVALIDSSAFADEKQGILKFVSAVKRVNAEFQPRYTDLQTLQSQIQKAEVDLQKAAPVQDQKVTQQQQDKIDQMKKDYQRKGEDLQTAGNKRLEEVLGPIYEEIGKALDTFAKARGITLILDVSKVQGIVSAADSLDITRAFIAEYNSKNPATASLAAPK
jgi:Skp family chaperone for outer membrane proteins